MGDSTSNEVAKASECPATSSNSKSAKPNYSLVEFYGRNENYCGYCKKDAKQTSNRRLSYDMNSFHLTALDYQDMLDRGWRRSGSYCYNPVNQLTCCPNYSIVCKADEFIFSRSHRKCIMAMNSFLLAGDAKSKSAINYQSGTRYSNPKSTAKQKTFVDLQASSKARDRRFVKACERKMFIHGLSLDAAINAVRERWLLRRQPTPQLDDYLYPKRGQNLLEQPRHELVISLCHVESRKSREMREAEHSIMVRYQKVVHDETRKEWDMSRYCDFLVDSPIIVQPITDLSYLDNINNNVESNDELSLDVNEGSQTEYLVRPPQLPTAYGTYHCSYQLDGKLIAVGVLDILPRCITTVYFFYDPDYAFLNLGIYSALVEISMTRQMNSRIKDQSLAKTSTRDYYLGFFVPECKKMHYKIRFRPSFLLCSKTFRYVPTQICMEKLRDNKYADFAEEDSITDGEEITSHLLRLFAISIQSPVDPSYTKMADYLRWVESHLGTRYIDIIVNGYLGPYFGQVGPDLMSRLHLKLDILHRTLLKRHERVSNAESRQEAVV